MRLDNRVTANLFSCSIRIALALKFHMSTWIGELWHKVYTLAQWPEIMQFLGLQLNNRGSR